MDPITAYLVQFLVGLAISAAVNLATQAFAPKSEANKAVRGFRGQYSYGGTTPLKIVLGTYGVPAHLEYRNTYGNSSETPNAFLVDVFSLSDYPIAGVTAAWIDTQSVSLPGTDLATPGYPIPQYELSGKDHAFYRFRDGTQTTALGFLTSKFGADSVRPWTSAMVGEGIAQAIMTARINDKLWSGWPSYMFQVQGAPVLDPRESDELGGEGEQAWGDVSTYAFSDNPAVLIYNILRGLHDADGNHIWGGRATAYQLPYENWAAAMNRCDQTIAKLTGSEKRYRAGIEISVNERPTDIIRELLIGCNGRIAYHQGQYFILIDVPEEADGAFSDADVLANEPVTLSMFPNLDDVVNGATATFVSPEQAWESKETAPYYRADLEAEDDGRRLLQSLTLRTVFSGTQAQRILKAVVEESRRFKRHAVALTPGFDVYRPLQVLAWTSAEFQYEEKLWLITSKTVDEWGTVYLALQEIDPADFEWDAEADETALTFAPLTPIVIPSQAVAGWAVEKYTDGFKPGIHLEWVGALDDIGSVQVLIRRSGEVLAFYDREFPYDEEHDTQDIYILGDPLRPVSDYEVAARFIPKERGSRPTDWTSWYAVTTDDVAEIEIPPIEVSMLGEQLANERGLIVGDGPGSLGKLVEDFLAEIDRLAGALATNNMVTNLNRQLVSARLGNATAAIFEERLARVTDDNALAMQITQLGAEFENSIATGLLKFEAEADEVSGEVNIMAKGRVEVDGVLSQAAWLIHVAVVGGIPEAYMAIYGGLRVIDEISGNIVDVLKVQGGIVKFNHWQSAAQIGGVPIFDFDGTTGNFSITV